MTPPPPCGRSAPSPWLLLLLLMLSPHHCTQQPKHIVSIGPNNCSEGSPKPVSPQGLTLGCSQTFSMSELRQEDNSQVKPWPNPAALRRETTAVPGNTDRDHPEEILNDMTPAVGQQEQRNKVKTTEVTLSDSDPHHARSRPLDEEVINQEESFKKDSHEDDLTLEEPSGASPPYNEMVLCDHAPNKFSPQFLSHPREDCAQEVFAGELISRTTMGLCNTIYRSIYGRDGIYHWLYQMDKPSLRLFLDENFNALCLPLFRRFNHCEERRFITICRDERVLFLHSHSCQQPSPMDKYFEKLLILSLILEEEECFHLVCEGVLRVIESSVSGVSFRLINLEYRYGEGKACQHLFDAYFELQQHNETIYLLANIFFPCCFANYFVLWVGKPEDHGLNSAWDFLPLSCRISEVLLLVAASAVGVFGAAGNLVVVMVMLTGPHQRTESTIIRTSLALADLLISLFIVIPSVADQISIIAWGELRSDKASWEFHTEQPRDIEYYNMFTVETGYRLFQALLLGTCSVVSLFSLFLLSVERFVVTSRGLAYKAYFSIPRVTALVIFTWLMALADTLTFTSDGSGNFTPIWSNFSKFTVGISSYRSGSLFSGLFYFRLFFLALMCTSTLVFSSLATVKFVQEQTRVREEWQTLNLRVSGPLQEENRKIIGSLILMTTLFPLSVIPVGVCVLLQEIAFYFDRWELFTYVCWWLFLAGSAWNPWLYNMRSTQFKKDMRETFCKMVPARFKDKLRPRFAHSRQKRNRTHEGSEQQMKLLRKIGLTNDQVYDTGNH